MSSSSMCQGLQSCLEPRVIEPRVLRLKLTPPGSNLSSGANTTNARASPSPVEEKTLLINNDKKDVESNEEGHGFGFLQALSNNSDCDKKEKEKQNEEVYVHPTVKRSSSMLSEKSLEMCTESLGSETGSNAGESIDDISLFETRNDDVVIESSKTNWGVSRRVSNNNNNNNRACNFPPPLTSITNFGGVHVRPHREGGRLILEAVASPSPTPYFHAERGDGRLILRLFEGVFDSEVEVEGEEEEEEEEVEEEEEEEEEVSEEEEEFEESVENVGDEMDVKKFARPSRCKENGNRDIFFGDAYFELPSLSLCL